MKKVEIIENFGRYRKGQTVEMDDFGIGHALAFKYGRLRGRVETQAVEAPETRVIDHVHEPVEDVEEKSFFKRRGRRSKNA